MAKPLKISDFLKEDPPELNIENAREIIARIESRMDDSLLTYKYKKVPLLFGRISATEIQPNVSNMYSEISKIIEDYKKELRSSFSPQTKEEIMSLIEKMRKWTKELMAYSKARLDEIAPRSEAVAR